MEMYDSASDIWEQQVLTLYHVHVLDNVIIFYFRYFICLLQTNYLIIPGCLTEDGKALCNNLKRGALMHLDN